MLCRKELNKLKNRKLASDFVKSDLGFNEEKWKEVAEKFGITKKNKMPNPYDKYITRETHEHIKLCTWLKLQHKNLFWWHTPNEGKKSAFERYLYSRMGARNGVSDFIIIEPRGEYKGLCIELKANGVKVFKRNGTSYFPEQHQFLLDMEAQGFKASFQCGFENAKNEIQKYLELK